MHLEAGKTPRGSAQGGVSPGEEVSRLKPRGRGRRILGAALV